MDFEIRPLSEDFGAEVIGLDLGRALSDHDFETVRRAWFEAGCREDDTGGGADCAAVLASPYSYLPPKHDKSARGMPDGPGSIFATSGFPAPARGQRKNTHAAMSALSTCVRRHQEHHSSSFVNMM